MPRLRDLPKLARVQSHVRRCQALKDLTDLTIALSVVTRVLVIPMAVVTMMAFVTVMTLCDMTNRMAWGNRLHHSQPNRQQNHRPPKVARKIVGATDV